MAQLTVNAIVLKQNGIDLYLFSMNSKHLRKMCFVAPRGTENPEEIQRILKPKRAQEIGEYIKQPTSILPNVIVINLPETVKILPTSKENEVTIQLPDIEGKFCYILDGQHRLAGFEYSEGIEFDLPIVALYNADEHMRGKVFADINSKQEKVSDVHILELYYQIKELPADETATMDIIHRLAKDNDSPFFEKIKLFDGEKNKWVKNKPLKQRLAPHVENGGVLYGKTSAVQTQIIKEYLKAVQAVWNDAWGNNDEYVLTKNMGIEIIFSIFVEVKHRCDLNEGKQYTKENFTRQLQPLVNCEIEMPGEAKIIMNWERSKMGILAHRAGRTLITKQFKNILRKADEE